MNKNAVGGANPSIGSLARDDLVDELLAAVQARDEFLAIAAHELRNPMTPVVIRLSSTIRMARADARVPKDIIDRLEQLHETIQNYLSRLNTLLDVSRITSGNLNLEAREMNLSELTMKVAANFEYVAAYSGSSLKVDSEPNIVGVWDPLAIEQVLQNLLSNAIKYSDGKPVALTVKASEQLATISVKDHGPGISAEDQARVFDKFERLMGRKPQAGFGVGLWVVHRLVQAMGGGISIESELGRGAEFTVTLPLIPAR